MLATEPAIIEKYVRAGKVRLIFRAVLNHGERSLRTTEAANCAAQQGKFWQMHELLFQKQDEVWGIGDAPGLVALMEKYGKLIDGLEMPSFKKCLDARTTLELIKAIDSEQRKRGITLQPIFEVGKTRVTGMQSVDQISALLDTVLK